MGRSLTPLNKNKNKGGNILASSEGVRTAPFKVKTLAAAEKSKTGVKGNFTIKKSGESMETISEEIPLENDPRLYEEADDFESESENVANPKFRIEKPIDTADRSSTDITVRVDANSLHHPNSEVIEVSDQSDEEFHKMIRAKWNSVCREIAILMDKSDNIQNQLKTTSIHAPTYKELLLMKDKVATEMYELASKRHSYCLMMDPSYAGTAPTPPKIEKEKERERISDADLTKAEAHLVNQLGKSIFKLKNTDEEAEIRWEEYKDYALNHNLSVYNFCVLLKLAVQDHKMSKTFTSISLRNYFRDVDQYKYDKSDKTFQEIREAYFTTFVDPGYQERAMLRLFSLCYRVNERTIDFTGRIMNELVNAGKDPKEESENAKQMIRIFYYKYPIDVRTYMGSKGNKTTAEDFKSMHELCYAANQYQSIPPHVKISKVCCPQCDTELNCPKEDCRKIVTTNVLSRLDSKSKVKKCHTCGKLGHEAKECRVRPNSNNNSSNPKPAKKPLVSGTDNKKSEEKGNGETKSKGAEKRMKWEARKNNLCYHCKEPWAADHKCKKAAEKGTPKKEAKHLGMMDHSDGEIFEGEVDIYGSDGFAEYIQGYSDDENLGMTMVEAPRESEFIKMPAIIGGNKVLMGVDSYASISFMRPEFAEKCGIKILPQQGSIILAKQGVKIPRMGRTEPIEVYVAGKGKIMHQFDIWDLPNQVNIVLGLDGFKAFGVQIGGIPIEFPTEAEMTK